MKPFVIFLLSTLLFTSCAPKDEELLSISGGYTLAEVNCLLKTDYDAGAFSNLVETWTVQNTGESVQMILAGRAWSTNTATAGNCQNSGSFGITSRLDSSSGYLEYELETSNSTNCPITLVRGGNLTATLDTTPNANLAANNIFTINSNPALLVIALPFDITSGTRETSCQGDACRCLLYMVPN